MIRTMLPRLRSVLSFPVLTAGLALAAWTALPAGRPGPAAFQVRAEAPLQTMAGFGAGFNEATEECLQAIHSAEDRARAYDLLYGDSGARLNIVRLKVSPHARLRPGAAPADAAAWSGKYDWASDVDTQRTWQAIRPVLEKTRPVLYAVPFTPPVRWKTNGQLSGGSLKREDYRAYAEYLCDFLAYCRGPLGAGIDALSLQNEPGVAAPWQSCLWTGTELRDFIKIAAPLIRAAGLKTRIMLSEGTSWSGAWEHLLPTLQDPEARGFLNIMASHSYGSPGDAARRSFAAASGRNGLPIWMSEMSLMEPPAPDDPGMPAAIRIARYIHRDLVEGRASAWIFCFAIFRSSFPGSMGVLAPADGSGSRQGALVVPKRFWAMAHYSRFVRPGWAVVGVDGAGADNTAFIDPQGDGFVVVAVNPEDKAVPAAYDFGVRTISAVRAFVTTKDLDLAEAASPEARDHGFSALLPPRSVTTFAGGLGR